MLSHDAPPLECAGRAPHVRERRFGCPATMLRTTTRLPWLRESGVALSAYRLCHLAASQGVDQWHKLRSRHMVSGRCHMALPYGGPPHSRSPRVRTKDFRTPRRCDSGAVRGLSVCACRARGAARDTHKQAGATCPAPRLPGGHPHERFARSDGGNGHRAAGHRHDVDRPHGLQHGRAR